MFKLFSAFPPSSVGGGGLMVEVMMTMVGGETPRKEAEMVIGGRDRDGSRKERKEEKNKLLNSKLGGRGKFALELCERFKFVLNFKIRVKKIIPA